MTAFLVRSTATGWKKGSLLAVDAGVHLSAITRILDTHKTSRSEDDTSGPITLVDGPFEGIQLPHQSMPANAAFITRELVDCYLITHPHLDHICGFVINTASLPAARPKRVAGLPATIDAIKTHIFNNIIWPNLSDENNGAGLVTYMRLIEGGSPALGDGDSRGYVEVCDGLSVKTLSVSHGSCIEKHSHRNSLPPNFNLMESTPLMSPALKGHPMTRTPSAASNRPDTHEQTYCVYDSSTHFIRDIDTGKELIIFGDVEPDSISFQPRNLFVWKEAAPKIASGMLSGILIECSYDDSRPEELLFGHLTPSFLMEELKNLADEVATCISGASPKRKRESNGSLSVPPHRQKLQRQASPTQESPLSPKSVPGRKRNSWEATAQPDGADDYSGRPFPRRPTSISLPKSPFRLDGASDTLDTASAQIAQTPPRSQVKLPLKGLRVVIIHVKERLDDGPDAGDIILEQLLALEEEAALGCEFIISYSGQALYF